MKVTMGSKTAPGRSHEALWKRLIQLYPEPTAFRLLISQAGRGCWIARLPEYEGGLKEASCHESKVVEQAP